jgi:hypothetical protein
MCISMFELVNLVLVVDHVCLACYTDMIQVMVFGGLDGILTSFAIVSVSIYCSLATLCAHTITTPMQAFQTRL